MEFNVLALVIVLLGNGTTQNIKMNSTEPVAYANEKECQEKTASDIHEMLDKYSKKVPVLNAQFLIKCSSAGEKI